MGFSGSGEAELVPSLRFPEFRNSLSWKRKSLSELFAIGSGRDYKHLEKGKIPVYGTGGYMLSVDGYLHDGESVCIGRKGTIDKPMFLCGKFWTVDTLFYTHSFKNCLPKFIYFCFQNIKWLAYNEATGVPSLSKSIIEKIEIKIPVLEEQDKISGCLSSIDDLINLQIKKLDLLKAHKKGLLKKLLPSENETVPKLRFHEFQNFSEWRIKKIGEISRVKTGDKDTQNKEKDGTYPFFVRSQTIEKINSFSHDGEAILTSGDGVGVGKNFHYIDGKFDFHQRVYCICDFVSEVSAKFIYFYFSENFNARIERLNAKTSVDSVRMPMITDMLIQLPSLVEQQKIADCLCSLDDLILLQGQKINALKSHKRGLMQALFPALD